MNDTMLGNPPASTASANSRMTDLKERITECRVMIEDITQTLRHSADYLAGPVPEVASREADTDRDMKPSGQVAVLEQAVSALHESIGSLYTQARRLPDAGVVA